MSLTEVLEINWIIIYFVYGQVFFVMGLATGLQWRRQSRLELARPLPWLAAFGVALVNLSGTGGVDARVVLAFVGFGVAFGSVHLAIRRWTPNANPYIYPLAAILTAVGFIEIYRLDPDLAALQQWWLLASAAMAVAGAGQACRRGPQKERENARNRRRRLFAEGGHEPGCQSTQAFWRAGRSALSVFHSYTTVGAPPAALTIIIKKFICQHFHQALYSIVACISGDIQMLVGQGCGQLSMPCGHSDRVLTGLQATVPNEVSVWLMPA